MNSATMLSCGLVIAMGLFLHWLPLWRRENQYFGVTTATGFDRTGEGRHALFRFRLWTWLGTALAVILTAGALQTDQRGLAPAATLVQIGVAVGAFAMARRNLARFAIGPQARTASLEPDRERLPGGIAGAVLPLAILAAAGIYVASYWDLLPERIPVHWDLTGQPNRWVDRTVRGVVPPLGVGVLVWAVLFASAIGILKTSRRPSGENADWTRRFRQANLRLLVAVMHVMAILFAGVAARPILAAQGILIPGWLAALAPLAVIVAFTIPIVRLSNEPGSGGDATPDECWYWGQFYYNPNDPALMVEKRFGVGYTFNFGNWLSWLFLLIPVAIIIGTRF